MVNTWTNRAVTALIAGACLMGLTACQGDPPRRVTLGETTESELRSPKQQTVSLTEFQETAANDMLQALPDVRGIAGSPERSTILMGDINNKTSLVSTTDYEYIASGIRSRLIRARAADNLKFVEKRRRVENLATRERVATAPAPPAAGSEEIAWGGGSYYVPDYDANTTFGMMMDVYRINRGNTNLYYIEVQLVHFATNEIVYSYKSEMKQVSVR